MILLLLFVTCLVTVTNLMLVIMKEQRGAGAGGHRERGFRGFLWGFFFFLFSVFFEWLRVFLYLFFFPRKDLYVSGCGVCVFIFLVGGLVWFLKAASCWERWLVWFRGDCLKVKEFNLFGTRPCRMNKLLIMANECFSPENPWDEAAVISSK